jgi:phosphate transport system protein
MGDLVVTMLRTAMEAFAKRDLELCQRVPVMDDPVDRLNRATHLEALKLADDPRSLDWGLHMNMAARALERVGDNAVDIAEQVGFLVTGEFREYTDASHPVDV